MDIINTINIVADDRERPSGIPAQLAERAEVGLSIRQLILGDYWIDDWLVIERKAMKDLVQSLMSGRLFDQAFRLANCGLKTAIIIEGSSRDIENYHIHRNAILGALVTLSLIFGITILRSANPAETVNLMIFCGNQNLRNNSALSRRSGYKPKSAKKRRLFILQGLPMVGPVIAKRLLAHFGSVKAVFNATLEELQAVEGVGPVMAEKIVNIVK